MAARKKTSPPSATTGKGGGRKAAPPPKAQPKPTPAPAEPVCLHPAGKNPECWKVTHYAGKGMRRCDACGQVRKE